MYRWIRPLLFALDPESAHDLTLEGSRLLRPWVAPLLRAMYQVDDERLSQTLWGLPFANPVGLAAGMDKNARLIRFWSALGFGFVEVGSVTARPSSGNPRPRLFRLPEDRALLNRMGLNNEGAAAVAERLKQQRETWTCRVGVNLAKTHDPAILGEAGVEDFVDSFAALAPQADYIALNVSCPNTTEGKTFEDPEALDALLRAIFARRTELALEVPVLVKLSPPASTDVAVDGALRELLAVVETYDVAGIIATNTASDRVGLRMPPERLAAIGSGGLSGVPLHARSIALIRVLYRTLEGRLPIVGVGGIHSPETAYATLRAGASLLELYTGLIYEGPGLVSQINQGLVALLERDGLASIADAVGLDAA